MVHGHHLNQYPKTDDVDQAKSPQLLRVTYLHFHGESQRPIKIEEPGIFQSSRTRDSKED